ncbi:MAG: S-layer homology domain-containing protein [Candidatus Riflebacteria bacterium]|nr:S-layer homology domain-containing protein [Candidatus Riflebacteria bacterium]
MKRISMLLVAVMVLSTVVASANPFSDVPFSHWAYDAVNKLAANGILQGYPDGRYKGNQTVTRYALAMVTAKMLANVEQMLESGIGTNLVTKADLQTLEKLTVEFADELALLGVKVTALEDDMQVVKEDVSMLKKDVEGIKDYMAKGGMEKVKLSGDMLVRHTNLNHQNDWANDATANALWNGRAGNSNNSLTESQIRFQFKANIDENITAVARWSVFAKNVDDVNGAQSAQQGAFGRNGIGATTTTDNTVDLAYLHIKDMFRFGGDFTFGRNFYTHGHALLLNAYADAVRYTKRSGDIDVTFQTIYDRHIGSYKDDGILGVDFRQVWNLNLGTKYRDHDLYMGIYMQDEPNYMTLNKAFPTALYPFLQLGNASTVALANQSSDSRWDVEFGSKGPIGNNGHWDYDLGFAYTSYEVDIHNTAATTWINPEMQGWMGHVAVKWDSKKEWAAKLAFTFADDESVGALALNNDMRYQDGIETPYEDIARGNQYFNNGLLNMTDLKLQAEYRPRDSKHYFRLAGDFLNEMDDTVTNDLTRYQVTGDATTAGVKTVNKISTAYDRWNNFGIDDAEAMVLTFEYRYQLAENTRIKVGYTNFEFLGDALKNTRGGSAGRGIGGSAFIPNGQRDFDYDMLWAEIYSRF